MQKKIRPFRDEDGFVFPIWPNHSWLTNLPSPKSGGYLYAAQAKYILFLTWQLFVSTVRCHFLLLSALVNI